MERIITVRSSETDITEKKLISIGRHKEKELTDKGIINSPIFNGVCIAPSLEEGKLGYFAPSGLLIAISEDVIENCDETTIRNIFLHELSHALDYNLHGALSGHSPKFRECCRIIGVEPGFEKSRIRSRMERNNEAKNRIRKLMALSSSPFENEAAEAIKKAKILMARNGISLESKKNERIYMVPLFQAKRFPFSIRQLLSYISDITGVYIVISQGPDKKTAIAYGSLEETELSIYLYDYLISSIEHEIRKRRKDGEKISKDSFLSGAIAQLSKKTADVISDNAIIAIKDENKRLTKKIIYPDVKLKRTITKSHGGDVSSYTKGLGFGSKLAVPTSIGKRELE